jgi:ATP-dependent exoDNAse (exonuclease V) beta subunit
VTLTCFDGRDDVAEASHVVALIRQARNDFPQGSVAVLVRSRGHLAALIPALKEAGLVFQAQEIDSLTSRPVIRDLLALTRALLHPADRIAWLSVLRAPWCGLCLDDMLLLCGNQTTATIWECLPGHAGQGQLFSTLSPDGQARLARVTPVLGRVLAGKGRMSLRRMIETAWLALCGPAGLTGADLDDAEQFFALLDELDEGCDLLRLEMLEERLGKLFAAPDPTAGTGLQLMTIHKAKGLEFDTVIIPGLGRSVRPPERSLLVWQERPDPGYKGEGLLLAPMPASAADDQDRTYQAIARLHAEKDKLETIRLLYVAATRARQRLCLLGHAERNKNGILSPATGSLLKAAWPALSAQAEACTVLKVVTASNMTASGVLLRRLPQDWSPPPLQPPLAITTPVARRASDVSHREDGGTSLALRTEFGRVVGTVVHQWLERIACEGVSGWTEDRLHTIRQSLQDSMINQGISRAHASQCVARSLVALGNILRSPRGRWILDNHAESDCELALTGVIDGMTVHAVIDRTFVDSDGIRWVVDYKTSESADARNLELFIAEEVERYRSQLEDYKRLLSRKKPGKQIRGALYFPIQDLWCEVD